MVAAESNEPADHRHAARVWTYAANATTDPWQRHVANGESQRHAEHGEPKPAGEVTDDDRAD